MKYLTKQGNFVIEVPVTSDVHPAWKGWRFTEGGSFFVTPDGQHLSERRVLGIAWRDEMELRLAGHQSRRKAEKRSSGAKVKVVIVDLGEWRERHFGRMAG